MVPRDIGPMDILKSFQVIQEKTKDLYPQEILCLTDITYIDVPLMKIFNEFWTGIDDPVNKCSTSLLTCCDWEVCMVSGQIVFLTNSGLYRNAISDIRFLLEMSIQAFYIDSNHVNSTLETKWEILKEVGGKRGYRSAQIIDSLKIENNKELQFAYKQLCEDIHASNEKAKKLFFEIKNQNGVPSEIRLDEIENIKQYLNRFYDIFYFLFFTYFKECLPNLKKDKLVMSTVKRYNLKLLDNLINMSKL